MTLINKTAITVTAIGTIGGVGAYAGGVFNNKQKKITSTIAKTKFRDRLKDEGFEILDTKKDSNDWKDVLDVYKNATIRSFTGEKEEKKTQEQLGKNCEDIWDKDAEDNKDYTLLIQWCVKKENMKTILNRGKRKPLSFEDQVVEGEQKHWEEKIKELRKDKGRFKAIENQINDSDTALTTNISAIKKGCRDLQIDTMVTTEDKFSENFKLAQDWCTIPTN